MRCSPNAMLAPWLPPPPQLNSPLPTETTGMAIEVREGMAGARCTTHYCIPPKVATPKGAWPRVRLLTHRNNETYNKNAKPQFIGQLECWNGTKRSIDTRESHPSPMALEEGRYSLAKSGRAPMLLLRVRLPGAPGAPGIQINDPVVHPNALPLDITPSSGPGTLSTNDTTKHHCR